MNNEFTVWFEEIDRFNPVTYIQAQQHATEFNLPLRWSVVLEDSDSLEVANPDGVLEPFMIRELPSLYSHTAPADPHSTKGAVMAGNEDETNSSDLVLTVYNVIDNDQLPFEDDTLTEDGTVFINGTHRTKRSFLTPFVDERFVCNVSSSANRSAQFNAALSMMTGSDDNYFTFKQKSMPCGQDYDRCAAVGTDSLAFGGTGY